MKQFVVRLDKIAGSSSGDDNLLVRGRIDDQLVDALSCAIDALDGFMFGDIDGLHIEVYDSPQLTLELPELDKAVDLPEFSVSVSIAGYVFVRVRTNDEMFFGQVGRIRPGTRRFIPKSAKPDKIEPRSRLLESGL